MTALQPVHVTHAWRRFAATTATILAGTAWLLATPRTDVQRYVTVVDSDGRPVLGLSHEDFALKDGGVRRPIVSVEQATAPISATVVVRGFSDAELADVRKAVETLQSTRATTPQSPALFVTFAGGAGPSADDTNADVRTLPQAIDAAARAQVADGFDRRMVLAIIKRGGNESGVDPEASADVVDALTDAKSALWTLEVAAPPAASPLDKLLSAATDASGSIRTKVKSTADLPNAARDLFYIWRGQYLVTYTWPDPMLSFFKLEVRHDRGVVLTTGWER